MLASWPWPLELELLEPALFNDARGFSHFDFARFHFRADDCIALRVASRAAVAVRLGPGGVDPTP
jgi:hypothetical protein